MSARQVQVRIGRLVVDAPLHGEADELAGAIGRALQQRYSGVDAAGGARAELGLPATIAHALASRIGPIQPGGGRHEHA